MEFDLLSYVVFFVAAFLGGFIVPPHLALGTNKLQGVFGSFTATLNFTKKGLINYKECFVGIVFTFIGATIGATLILFLNANFLKIIIPFLLIAIFIYTLFMPKIGDSDRAAKMNERLFYVIFGLILGFYDGFFGPGAGSFWMFAMVALIGLNLKKAVAHTKALNFTSNIVALGVFIAGGQILWLVGFLTAVGQILGAYFGSNLVIKKEVKFIRTMFLIVVAATICKLLFDYFKA